MSSLEFKGTNSIKLVVFGKIYSTVTALFQFLLFQRYIVFFKVSSPNKKKKYAIITSHMFTNLNCFHFLQINFSQLTRS